MLPQCSSAQMTSPCSKRFPIEWWRLSFPYPPMPYLSDCNPKTHLWKRIGKNWLCYLREHQCAAKESYPLDWLNLDLNSPHTFAPSHPFSGLARYWRPILGAEQWLRNQRWTASSPPPLSLGTSTKLISQVPTQTWLCLFPLKTIFKIMLTNSLNKKFWKNIL